MTLAEDLFGENKERLYKNYEIRCRRLLRDFVKQKRESVCPYCESKDDCSRLPKNLRSIINLLVGQALRDCKDRDTMVECLAMPLLAFKDTCDLFPKRRKGFKARAKKFLKEVLSDF